MQLNEKLNTVPESGNRFKNGTSPKSRISRRNFKNLPAAAILLCFCAFTNTAMAWEGDGTSSDPWLIGDGTVANVTAVLSGNTLTISGNGNMADFLYSTEGEAPWWFDTANRYAIRTVNIQTGVTNIGDRAFHDLKNLELCAIPNTVTQIGKEALYMEHETNTSFKSITIPNSVNYVEGRAFTNCSGLETVEIQNGKTDITFLPSTDVNYYYNDHFTGCTSLKTLHWGRHLYVGDGFAGVNPFSGGPIQSLTIGNTVTLLEGWTNSFAYCNALKEVILEDGEEDLDFDNDFSQFSFCPIETFYCGRNIVNCIVWGQNTSPFVGSETLTTVTIGKYVKSIIENAFSSCSKLTSVTIPESVESIGNFAFNDCGLTSITIPSSVISIGDQAFGYCDDLTNVYFSDGDITLILAGNLLFTNSNSIQTVHYGRNLGGDDTPFQSKTALTTITFSNNITSIPSGSFADCIGLRSVTLPKGIISIGSYAFYGCELTEIHSQNPTPPTTVDNNCFYNPYYNVYATCRLYVPQGSVDLYNNVNQPEWKKFFDNDNGFEDTGINDVLANQLSIFPNPAQNDLFINSELQIEKVEIYSLTGALLLSENNFVEKISVSGLSQGVYLLKVYTDKGVVTGKVVKE
ncbi:MAG: leucine-rich repeat domain-containing protein [Candidatus Azobacteroides sp.]|nr:leucine-rich repeat domain-containing protein [Candidatus Azobacteroides sp.]